MDLIYAEQVLWDVIKGDDDHDVLGLYLVLSHPVISMQIKPRE